MSRLPVLLILAVLFSPAATRADEDPRFVAFEQRFAELTSEAGIPGGAYAIVSDGRISHAVGHGVRRVGGDAPVTADTVFRIASVSKTMAAQLTALLVGEGRLRWDDPIADFLPDLQFKQVDHAGRLQVQHLLGQSTGFVPNAYDNLLNADVALERILPQFRTLAPICAPGECYTYQNILFGLIDPVIRQAGHEDYSQLVRQRLFEPLQMHQASLGIEAFHAAADRAEPHVRRRGRWVPGEVKPSYYQVAPAAGVNASATDLGKWLLAQLGHHPAVLPPETIDELLQKRVRTQRDLRRRGWREMLTDAHYGLGWRIYQVGDDEIYLHSGWVQGFVADISYSRRHQTGLVVLLNAESGILGELGATFWASVLQHAAEAPVVASGTSVGAADDAAVADRERLNGSSTAGT
jgi:beta-lactamase class C